MADEFEWQASLVESDLLHLIKNPRDALKGEKLDTKTTLQLWAIGDLLDQHIDTDESIDSLGNNKEVDVCKLAVHAVELE